MKREEEEEKDEKMARKNNKFFVDTSFTINIDIDYIQDYRILRKIEMEEEEQRIKR